ncbi:MAG TPA: YopT-type cysteine protease domain-containing protein [Planctomycetota bacterium]|nr:YopT-type cysteine protease domain-containing protein [Planctomycetota bacterium]
MAFKITDHGAQVVHPYSQGRNFPHMQLDAKARGGVCKALSIYWMVNRAKGGDFWTWLSSVKGIATVINTQATGEAHQKRVHAFGKVPGQVDHGNDGEAWIAQVLSTGGLSKISEDRRTVKFMEAADWILHDTGQFKLIGLRGSAGGHAVAVHVSANVVLMDPNFGEIQFPAPGNFMAWFPNFVKLYQFRDTPTSPVKTFDTVVVRPFGTTRARR